MMNVRLTRKQVLDLMKELPENHWFQNRLLNALNDEYARIEPPVDNDFFTVDESKRNDETIIEKTIAEEKPENESDADDHKIFEAKDVVLHDLNDKRYIGKDYVKGNTTCNFSQDWLGTCKKRVVLGKKQCLTHYNVKCRYCNNVAFETCDYTGQFVCGQPVCSGHNQYNHRH